MKISLTIVCNVSHVSGKFASKDGLAELVRSEVETELSLDTVETDDGAEYSVDIESVSIEESQS